MEPIEYDFEFPRGDSVPIRFRLKDYMKRIIVPTASTEIYFTLKTNYRKTEYVLQKKYSTGDIYLDGEFINIFMKHTDTASLKLGGTYDYDISVIDGDYAGTLYFGTITLTREATHLANE